MKSKDLLGNNTDTVFALIYGGSGTGKTELIGTLGELGKVLIIDIDKGYKTLKYSKRVEPFRDNLYVVSFDTFKDLDAAYKLAKDNDPEKWDKAIGIKEKFDWIVFDTWSELQWAIQQQLRTEQGINSTTLEYRKNLQIQHWGMMTDLNKLSVESLRDCDVNIVLTMQETMTRDEISGQIFGGPAIHGKLVQEMPAYFDIVVHTTVDLQGNFIASTKPKGKWPAKTRIGTIEEYKNPYAKQIFTV